MTDIKANGNVAYAHGKDSIAVGRDLNLNLISDDSNEVSYIILEINHSDIQATLSKLNAEINVRIDSETSQNRQLLQDQLPFVPFAGFENLKNKNKILLFGRSGSGKSRSLIELVKARLQETTSNIQKIYVINPVGNIMNISRATVSQIVNQIMDHDLIVWDNFPDDMNLAVDVKYGLHALATVSSARVKSLIATLNPTLLEKYRSRIEGINDYLNMQDVRYGQNEIKSIIENYGNDLTQFKALFDQYIKDSIDEISQILFNNEPTPFAVIIFLESLKKHYHENPQGAVDVIKHAKNFPTVSTYYEQQFEKILNSRSNDADFLYALKFCSDLRLPRTLDNISHIQKILLGSESPDEPAKRLSIWISQMWEGLVSYYFLHELAKRAIDFAEEKKPKVMRNFCDKIIEILEEYRENPLSIRAVGRFAGQNIQFLPRDNKQKLIPDNLSDLYESDDLFLLGLAEGCGSIIHLLNHDFQTKILELGYKYPFSKFMLQLVVTTSEKLTSLHPSLREKLLKSFVTGDKVSYLNHAWVVASKYTVDEEEAKLQAKMLSRIEKNKETESELLKVMRKEFSSLDKEWKEGVFELAEKENNFAVCLGISIRRKFDSFDNSLQQELRQYINANRNNRIAQSFQYSRL
jgi:GTPase SAR1 family protein